MIWLWK